MESAEFQDAEAVWRYYVGFATEQVLGFVARDLRHGREDVRAVSRGSLHAVAVVDATIARLFVQVEVRYVVVKVAVAGAEVAAE